MEPKNKIVLTPEQREWLMSHFAETKNKDVAAHLGISETTVHRFAREMGLTKTRSFFLQCQRGAADAAKKWWIVTGRHRPKKVLPSYLAQYKYRKGEKPWTRCGMEKWKDAVERGAAKRAQTRREEKARHRWGLPQRTRLRVAQQPREKIYHRYYLKKHGYILDEVNLIAYWTAETTRCVKLEAGPRRYYHFKQHPTL